MQHSVTAERIWGRGLWQHAPIRFQYGGGVLKDRNEGRLVVACPRLTW